MSEVIKSKVHEKIKEFEAAAEKYSKLGLNETYDGWRLYYEGAENTAREHAAALRELL